MPPSRYRLTSGDRQVLDAASSLETGGIPVFTAHYFSPIDGTPRWDLVWRDSKAAKDADILSPEWNDRYRPDEWEGLGFKPEKGEYIPWIPLGWQAVVAHDDRLDVSIIAGFGSGKTVGLGAILCYWCCLAPEARIYDAGQGEYVAAKTLWESGRSPQVLAWTGDGFTITDACPVTLMGQADHMRVSLADGRVVTVAPHHHFLTPGGWKALSSLDIGDHIAVLPREQKPLRIADGRPVLKTPLGSPGGYPGGFHQRDAQSREALGACPGSVQLPTCALEHTGLRSWCVGVLGDRLAHSRLCQDTFPPSTWRLVAPVWKIWGRVRHLVYAFASKVRRLLRAALAVPRSPGQKALPLELVGGSRPYCQCTKGSAGNLASRGRGTCVPCLSPGAGLRSSTALHVQRAADQAASVLEQFRPASCEYLPSLSPSMVWCAITDIGNVGHGDYYDLHVPLYHNYVAEATISHNCQIPRFRAMNLAPVGWQAKQMYDAIRQELVDYDNRHERPTQISKMVVKMIERPYPKIIWFNGSTIEFMSADEQGRKILSWSGDVAVVDEAGKLNTVAHTDLNELLVNLGSRMRGAVGGRKRMGKLITMSTADFDPELWERYDLGESLPQYYLSLLVTTYDNPYNTKRQIDAIERRIRDPEKRRHLMLSERPLPKGKEFTRELLKMCQCEGLDEVMDTSQQNEIPGYERAERQGAGVIKWVTPASAFDRYVLVGDPGQNTPPNRNSAVVMVFKVTGFPQVPAELAAFSWVVGGGKYWPFIQQMREWYGEYKPIYSAFDATGVQKGFDELVFSQAGMLMEGLNMQFQKMQMVLALKLIMGKGLLLMPRKIEGIWMQLAGWRMPDTKLRQDIASCLFMVGGVLNRLFVIDSDIEDEAEWEPVGLPGRLHRRPNYRVARQNRGRSR